MLYAELLEALTVALRYLGYFQLAKTAVEEVAKDDAKQKHLANTVLRGAGLMLTQHLQSGEPSTSKTVSKELVARFLRKVDHDMSNSPHNSNLSDMTESYINAYVRNYVDNLAPSWTTSIQESIDNVKRRPTFRQMIDSHSNITSDSHFMKSIWPDDGVLSVFDIEEKGKETKINVPPIGEVLEGVKKNPKFIDFSRSLAHSSVNINQYVPFRMLQAWKSQKLATSAYFDITRGRPSSVQMQPFLPFITDTHSSIYHRISVPPVAKGITRDPKPGTRKSNK